MPRAAALFLTIPLAVAAAMLAPRVIGRAPPASDPPSLPLLAPAAEPICSEGIAGAPRPSVVLPELDPQPAPLQDARAPSGSDLVVVIDTSGSMRVQGRLDHARRATRALHGALGPDDGLAIIAFSDAPTLVLDWLHNPDATQVDGALSRLVATGETDLHSALALGVDLLERRPDQDRSARVVLLSDGRANRGLSEPRALGDVAAMLADRGADVVALGLGRDHDPDALARIAARSGGAYRAVQRPSDLVEAFLSAAPLAARPVAALDLAGGAP